MAQKQREKPVLEALREALPPQIFANRSEKDGREGPSGGLARLEGPVNCPVHR
jgi:hypothetical protein